MASKDLADNEKKHDSQFKTASKSLAKPCLCCGFITWRGVPGLFYYPND